MRDQYFDQLKFSGHCERISDLDLFAGLGIKVLRYPVLWENVEREEGKYDWAWADERLNKIRELGMQPLVGLVHHGSGPTFTSLLDPQFPEKLAGFARKVAERYPWVRLYNPVNEPLTTARFSGLYGHWYPHASSVCQFLECLVNECKAVILAMDAVKEVCPEALLVQSEDLGKTHSTPKLSYQAELENERRWLSYDLLTGNPPTEGVLYRHMRESGVPDQWLHWFKEHKHEPDMLGINYYVTSERFLDDDLRKYPLSFHGGNHQEPYADVEAVRVDRGMDGAATLFKEAWNRYRIPIAVTEAHLSCTREEQMRWLNYIWQSAQDLRRHEVDIRAVTVWSLLGAYDWNSLLTRMDGYYESGAFDMRTGSPRPTALASFATSLSSGKANLDPLADTPGWWSRPERVLYPARVRPAGWNKGPRIAITGATGTLGKAFARLCDLRAIPYVLLSRQDVDIADRDHVERALDEIRPWAVINTAGFVRVDDAEHCIEDCMRENTLGPTILAEECNLRGVQLVTFSSDLVFDGEVSRPYVESDAVAPLNVYGRTKALAEAQVLERHDGTLVVRTSAFFGPWDEHNFITMTLRSLLRHEPVHACQDAKVSPTYVPDLVNATLDLIIDREYGVWHLANQGETTWVDFARHAAEGAGLDAARVQSRLSHEMGWVAKRPTYSVLSSERGVILPSLQDAFARYLEQCECLSLAGRPSKAYVL